MLNKFKKVDEFLAEVKTNGVAKNNRFEFVLNTPNVFSFVNENSSFDQMKNKLLGFLPFTQEIQKALSFATDLMKLRRIRVLCEAVNVPGFSLGTYQSRIYGEFTEIPYEVLYEPLNATFYVDANLDVKHWFDTWISAIQNKDTRDFRYYRDYVIDAELDIQNKKDQTVYSVKFYEMYPKAIGAVQLDANNKDIMKVNVTFVYKYYKVEKKQPVGPFSFESLAAPANYFRDFRSFQKGLGL
jgi:hypothetical protein